MTITSNIHTGLAAWTNHTFTLGERCGTGGNAYQCITAGTSTSAPTGTSADVDNGGTAHFKWLSAINYTGIQAWNDAIATPLTQPVIGLIWNDGVINCTLGVRNFWINGHVTTSTNTITLACAPGESFRDQPALTTPLTADSTKGVTIRGAASGTPSQSDYFWIDDDNVIIDGIQFVDPLSTSQMQIIIAWKTNFRLQGCIFDGYSQTSGGNRSMIANVGATTYVIENCLFVDRAASNTYRAIYDTNTATTAGRVVNCTFIATASAAPLAVQVEASATNGVVIKNTVAMGHTVAFGSSTVAACGVDHCVLSATGLGGFATNNGSNLFSKTAANQFVSTTVDFRLKAGADCLNAGAVDTADIPSSEDIFGTSRGAANWDVGCYEYTVSVLRSADVNLDFLRTVVASI